MEEVVGYGFHPTNEQLVGHYLRKKRLDPDYSHPKITEININDHEPSELLGESDASERYLFVAPRYTNTKRKLVKRRTRGGTWKATGKKPDVKDKRSKEVIGSKRKLVFYEGPSTRNKNARTNYVMDELHCNPDPLFKADFVAVRIKIKPDDSCDSSPTSESVRSHQLTSDSGDHIAEVSQVESQQLPNNDMSCNNEDYSGDIMFSTGRMGSLQADARSVQVHEACHTEHAASYDRSDEVSTSILPGLGPPPQSKDSQLLQNHDISPNLIPQSLFDYDISPNIIPQPLSHHHISLNREPDLLPNQDLSFNRGNQPLPNNHTSFNSEVQPLPPDITSFIREVQPLSNNNLSSILPNHATSFNTEVQPPANCNLPPHHEISTNREFQQLNYDLSFNREYQPQPHDISSNGESHVVPNYNLSSILPRHDISSNRESQPQLNHSLYPDIEELATKNTSSEVYVEPQVPAVWDSVTDNNGLDRNSFYTQQTQGWDSLIDNNGLDQNSFSAQQTRILLQQGSSHSCDFSDDSNVLSTPLGSEQEINRSNLQRDVQDEFSEKETGHSHTPDFHSTKPATRAAYVYGSSDESALLNGDSSGSNSPLGSEQETNWSNSQWGVLDEFYGKETVHYPPSGINSSMPVTEAHAYVGTEAHDYGGSDKTIDAMLSDAVLIDDPLLYGFSPTTYGEYGFNSMCQSQLYPSIDEYTSTVLPL